MAIEHQFEMDTPASRQDLRDALVGAAVGLDALPDWEHISEAASEATLVIIVELDDPALGAGHTSRPDNGVLSKRSLCFRRRDHALAVQFGTETVRGIMALLKAFPDTNAYLLIYDAAIPALLYKDGRLVLAQALTEDNRFWDAERQPYRALVDLPYTIAPLGPWPDMRIKVGRAFP